MRLVQAFEAVFLFGFRFARPTRERRGRFTRKKKNRTSCRMHDFHVRHGIETRNTYTTPIPLEAHRGSHIITSGLACSTVKHETAVVASFSSRDRASTALGHAAPGAPAIGMQRRITAMRSASGRRPRARSESSPDSLQTPHAACCGAVGQTPEHQTPPRSHLRAAWTGGSHRHRPDGEAAAEPRTHTAIRQGRPQQSSGSTSRSPRADIHPL